MLALTLGFSTPTSSEFVALDEFEGCATRALLLLLLLGVLVPLDVLEAREDVGDGNDSLGNSGGDEFGRVPEDA